MDPADWQIIQNDETFDIEVPARFWMDGETPIEVSVRRKSADALGNAEGFLKVSLKIDIDEFVDGQEWHGLTKLSLENGDDQDVVSEGLAWHLHRLASGPEGYGYSAALASWVTLSINGVPTGVYVSVEQRDQRLLENRGLWTEGETWLYEIEDPDQLELKDGEGTSPAVIALCYSPFQAANEACPTPDPATLAAELPLWIDMQGMLTLAAADTFAANPDALFNHGKNVFFADFANGTRLYFPWDLDSAIGQGGPIYPSGNPYSDVLLGVPEFRDQYTRIVNDLVCRPFQEEVLLKFLDDAEALLGAALAADPNNQIPPNENVAGHFDGLRGWASARIAEAIAGLDRFEECPPPQLAIAGQCPGTVTLSLSGLSPESRTALLSGTAEGSGVLPGGPCAGLKTGLADPRLLAALTAGEDGVIALERAVPGAACGAVLQGLDTLTCELTNVARMP